MRQDVAPGLAGTSAPAVEMSVGRSTVVFVTRPNVIAQTMGGHGYGAVPLGRGESAPQEAVGPLNLTLLKPAEPEPAEL